MTPKCCRTLTLFLAALLSGCEDPPPCQFVGAAAEAPSAGCLVLTREGVLLVESPRQQWGPPGGSVGAGEAAQCTAARETWEETGIAVSVGELARQFDNGFHLYWCMPNDTTSPYVRRPLEVYGLGYFDPEDFTSVSWRYAGQGGILKNLIREKRSEQGEQ